MEKGHKRVMWNPATVNTSVKAKIFSHTKVDTNFTLELPTMQERSKGVENWNGKEGRYHLPKKENVTRGLHPKHKRRNNQRFSGKLTK